jgi:hypothetical protein
LRAWLEHLEVRYARVAETALPSTTAEAVRIAATASLISGYRSIQS